MIILLTNDDGYESEGIRTLERVLASYGHEIWVCAPSANRSAQSHAMNIISPVKLTKYKDKHYHCSGTPTDCILYSLKANVFKSLPDCIISGINHGYNCSSDILYSGTCGAASEGVMHGIPSIALSAERGNDKEFCFESVATFVAKNIDKLLSLTTNDSFVNLNFPTPHTDKVVVSELGMISYSDTAIPIEESDGTITFRLASAGNVEKTIISDNTTDLHVASSGDISLSVIKIMPQLNHEKQEEAKRIFNA